jgi:hypothetical protein
MTSRWSAQHVPGMPPPGCSGIETRPDHWTRHSQRGPPRRSGSRRCRIVGPSGSSDRLQRLMFRAPVTTRNDRLTGSEIAGSGARGRAVLLGLPEDDVQVGSGRILTCVARARCDWDQRANAAQCERLDRPTSPLLGRLLRRGRQQQRSESRKPGGSGHQVLAILTLAPTDSSRCMYCCPTSP